MLLLEAVNGLLRDTTKNDLMREVDVTVGADRQCLPFALVALYVAAQRRLREVSWANHV